MTEPRFECPFCDTEPSSDSISWKMLRPVSPDPKPLSSHYELVSINGYCTCIGCGRRFKVAKIFKLDDYYMEGLEE